MPVAVNQEDRMGGLSTDSEHLRTLVSRLSADSVAVWIDGGWGVDALLGRQHRSHEDLDLVVEISTIPRVLNVLAQLDYEVVENHLPTRVSLRDTLGQQAWTCTRSPSTPTARAGRHGRRRTAPTANTRPPGSRSGSSTVNRFRASPRSSSSPITLATNLDRMTSRTCAGSHGVTGCDCPRRMETTAPK